MQNHYFSNPYIQLCAQTICHGGVVAYPTESVWGLGCDPFNELAVEKILTLKKRPLHKGVILVAGNIKQFDFLLKDLDWRLRERLFASWPGPNTWLVPHNNLVPEYISGEHKTVALRVSNHPVIQALCKACDTPIVSTSANPAGLPAARNQTQVRRYFKDAAIAISYSKGTVSGLAKPSTIRDLATGKVLRG